MDMVFFTFDNYIEKKIFVNKSVTGVRFLSFRCSIIWKGSLVCRVSSITL